MTISGVGSLNSVTLQPQIVSKANTPKPSEEIQTQMTQAKELMLQTLEFAFYMQQNMNLKLVRIAGQLYQGQNLDTTA
ncbi:hypothetical protein [Fervidobacterium sp.]